MTIDVHHNTKPKKDHKLSTYTGVMKIALHVLIFNKFCSYVQVAKTANFFWVEWLGMQLLTTFSKHILRLLLVLGTHVFAN
jgi:hypothetical protein